jgi:serine/threonine protein kinase
MYLEAGFTRLEVSLLTILPLLIYQYGSSYLHTNDFIHRDVKAANLLIDDDGTVLLGDLGVAASLHLADDSDPTHYQKSLVTADSNKRKVNFSVPEHIRPKIGKRKSFVGTVSVTVFFVQFLYPFLQPCWMSPELIQGHHYDSSSDIWSFGITALELTQGRPPRSRESSSKVLVKIVQDDPPGLDREAGQYKYSRAFKEVVESCLVKDPSKRFATENYSSVLVDLMHSNTVPLPHNCSKHHSSKMLGKNHILLVQFSVRIFHALSCSTVNAICCR